MIPSPSVRPVALCVLTRTSGATPEILVQHGYDRVTRSPYCRPPGGGIEFGEAAEAALRREMREELATDLDEVRLLGVIENLFTFEERVGHEIVFAFTARALDADLYTRDRLAFAEHDGAWQQADWVSLDRLSDPGGMRLVPPGLLDLIRNSTS